MCESTWGQPAAYWLRSPHVLLTWGDYARGRQPQGSASSHSGGEFASSTIFDRRSRTRVVDALCACPYVFSSWPPGWSGCHIPLRDTGRGAHLCECASDQIDCATSGITFRRRDDHSWIREWGGPFWACGNWLNWIGVCWGHRFYSRKIVHLLPLLACSRAGRPEGFAEILWLSEGGSCVGIHPHDQLG